ncbi:MAG: BMP family ABC transporter substrate-binding protein, partial [Oscillospiraceae bacterium]|nr:BMP family ABC transporter substrate-binding protein [Oscillospiraceae bacterium]
MITMKKFLALILALVMSLSLVACGGGETVEEDNADRDANVVFDNNSDTVDITTLDPAKIAEMKVGFIFLHDENSTYDLNFMRAAKNACEEIGVEYLVHTNIPEGQECYEAAAQLADAGCDIVFADSFGHEDYLIQAAKEFPEVEFCHATGVRAHTENLPNFHNAFATIYEGRYLAGVAAGMKLNEM